jgi:predicted MPP superfamily phosphohydrolase
VAAAGIAYSAGYEVRAFTIRNVTAPILPAGSGPIRVLHFSDLHLTPSQGKKQRWLRSLADLQPDLVVSTGDFIAHQRAVEPLLSALAPLGAIPKVFVFGSNDYYGPKLKNPALYLFEDKGVRIHDDPLPTDELRAGLIGQGWTDLTHTRATIRISDQAFEFRGTDDAHLGLDDYSQVAGPAAPNAIALGVTHAPYLRVLDAMENDELSMIFAGHTHGGQLCIPFYGALVTNCDLDRKRASGLSRHGRAYLHVSAGAGTNPYTPVRFACRPSATLVTLTAAK